MDAARPLYIPVILGTVRRGRMTWPELIEEIVPDITYRAAILSSLGIRPPPSE